MKKLFGLFLVALVAFSTPAFAGGHGCGGRGGHGCPGGGYYRPCRPCPPRPCHGGRGWNCSRDLGNAAAICSIVANGLAIANQVVAPAAYAAPVAPIAQPTVAAPVAVAQPVAAAPVAAQPVAAAPVVAAPVYTQPVYTSAPAPAVAPVVVAPYGCAGRVAYYGF